MVAVLSARSLFSLGLSVLALSSRFDGHGSRSIETPLHTLSVLALSSRFDGPAVGVTSMVY